MLGRLVSNKPDVHLTAVDLGKVAMQESLRSRISNQLTRGQFFAQSQGFDEPL